VGKKTVTLIIPNPGREPDGYHSCYTLAGLGAIQNRRQFEWPKAIQEYPLAAAFGWTNVQRSYQTNDAEAASLFDTGEFLEPLHPIFGIPFDAVEDMRGLATLKGEHGTTKGVF
jgi:protein farnesyltransferase subunit beta